MVIKFILLFLLLLIVLSLGAGMFSLIKDRGETDRTVKFLTYRIILSIVAFVILVVSFLMGWIQPHGLLPPAPPG
ncbi:MAG: twin transmembrane helix small protein [Proteobacteria bacterium]|nr:twin transmembrane helix small protein [Pseudomonadota bacterium]